MRKTMALVALAVLVLSVAAVAAADAAKTVEMKGWIACECCAAKNANAEGKSCTLSCAKSGAALVLVSEGKSYKLVDQKAALENVGHEVTVKGTVAADGSLKADSIQKAGGKA
jgi:hypothetical protein